MKKIMILFLVLMFILSTKNVYAQDQYKLTLEKQSGIYFSRKGENYNDDSYPYYLYKFGDIYAYCIEPGKHITTYTYVGEEEFVDLGFSEELKEKLELIGYYGRDYPGHNNVRYSMATQALIWELTGVDTVTFWTEQYEKGEEIDVTAERNEIMRLVNNHKTLPNLKSNYTVDLNKELTIYDTNEVLDNYEIEGDRDNIYIKDNTLHITPNSMEDINIKLHRKDYNDFKTIIFVGKGDNTSQKIARLHFKKDIETDLTINVKGITLLIQKVNQNNDPIKLANIKFKVKDLTRDIYVCENSDCIYNTNENGLFTVSNLNYGEYEIEELEDQFINGYTWNKEKLHVSLNGDTILQDNNQLHNYLELSFMNNEVFGSLELYKKGEELIHSDSDITYKEINYANVFFELYTMDNELIQTFATGPKGYVKIDNLKLGKYYLVEKYQLQGYLPLDKIYFEIKQNNQYQTNVNYELVVKNILKKGKLEFSKIDYDTNEGIPDTVIEIYSQYDTLLATKTTDENGKIMVDNLALGKYYIKEKEANDLYVKTDEKISFQIKGQDEVVQVTMTNQKKKGTLEFSKLDLATSEGIPNTIIEIYDENNNLLFTKETDEEGKVIINDLPLGKYYIMEKEANSSYVLTNEKVFFEIKENGEIVKASMTNEKIEVPVPQTNTKESIIAHSIFGICFLIGIGRMYYEKKYTY